jgi:small subunit ribosomal protein S9
VNSIYYYISTGRRKKAIARIRNYLNNDNNVSILINGKTVEEYFGGLNRLKQIALRPLITCNGNNQYSFYINVIGGGLSGQAEAISHGLARALLKLDKSLKITLKKEGFLTRDSRTVERKKSGRPKARKRFQFSKR